VAFSSTVMEKGGSFLSTMPSDTLMTMSSYVPTSPSDGRPESSPVSGSKLAHDGMFLISKNTSSPSGSWACGVKAYLFEYTTSAGGLPLIDGAVFDGVPDIGGSPLPGGSLLLAGAPSDPPSPHALINVAIKTKNTVLRILFPSGRPLAND
jgi:hypothetical protein